MAQRKEIVLPNQSIWDFACQHYGSPDGVNQLILDNPDKVNFNDPLVPGTELIVQDALNQKMVDFFASEVLKPASATFSNWILETGKWNNDGVWDNNANWNNN